MVRSTLPRLGTAPLKCIWIERRWLLARQHLCSIADAITYRRNLLEHLRILRPVGLKGFVIKGGALSMPQQDEHYHADRNSNNQLLLTRFGMLDNVADHLCCDCRFGSIEINEERTLNQPIDSRNERVLRAHAYLCWLLLCSC